MQQWWFDDDFGLKSVIYGVCVCVCVCVCFTIFPLFLEYANIGNLHLRSWEKGISLTFNLVP